ncbi:MAG: hypothetical protein K2Q10_02810 [Rhodospirillales bacterium]|nr:hypothetical protein [Rhodospirillales bacterium]
MSFVAKLEAEKASRRRGQTVTEAACDLLDEAAIPVTVHSLRVLVAAINATLADLGGHLLPLAEEAE